MQRVLALINSCMFKARSDRRRRKLAQRWRVDALTMCRLLISMQQNPRNWIVRWALRRCSLEIAIDCRLQGLSRPKACEAPSRIWGLARCMPGQQWPPAGCRCPAASTAFSFHVWTDVPLGNSDVRIREKSSDYSIPSAHVIPQLLRLFAVNFSSQ